MRRAALSVGVMKEFRALMPVWLASLAAIVAGVTVGGPFVGSVGIVAYVLGSVAVGSLSLGHEYSNRTLPLLLTQPVRRGRVFMLKMLVVAVLVLPLAAVQAYGTPREDWGLVMLPALAALFLAPWLTMVCRSTLPGMVFALSVEGSLWTAAELMRLAIYGWNPATRYAAQAFTLDVFTLEIVAACVIAAFVGLRTFVNLQEIEGPDRDLHLPQWLFAPREALDAPARRRSPYWLLFNKELRLQQLSFVISAILVVEWLIVSTLRRTVEGFGGPPFAVVTILYAYALALLVGSLASAEERQLGTLEWQVLLPIAAWRQWSVKIGTALGLVLLLALGLPSLLTWLQSSSGDVHANAWVVAIVIAMTVVGIYVSSVSSSGIRALMFAVPIIAGVPTTALSFSRTVLQNFVPFRDLDDRVVGSVLFAVFVPLLLWLALQNHRSADRGAKRVWLQVFAMSGCLMLCAVAAYFL
jgi:hypothetical protein